MSSFSVFLHPLSFLHRLTNWSEETGLTGDDASGEGGQEAHADQHQGDEPAPLVALEHD